jgi:hypothetical protein
LVRFENLGGFAAVAEAFTAEQISSVPDVVALDKRAEHVGGEDMIRTLEAVAATESLRRAATMLHLPGSPERRAPSDTAGASQMATSPRKLRPDDP